MNEDYSELMNRLLLHCYGGSIKTTHEDGSFKAQIFITAEYFIGFGERSPMIGRKPHDSWSRKDFGSVWMRNNQNIPIEMIHDFGEKFNDSYTMKIYFAEQKTGRNYLYRDVMAYLKHHSDSIFSEMHFAKPEQLDYFITKYLKTPE